MRIRIDISLKEIFLNGELYHIHSHRKRLKAGARFTPQNIQRPLGICAHLYYCTLRVVFFTRNFSWCVLLSNKGQLEPGKAHMIP